MKMSDQAELAEKTNEDIRAEIEMEEFCKHVVRHSTAQFEVHFDVGSTLEIPRQEILLNRYDLNNDELLDRDHVHYVNNMYAFPDRRTVPEHFSGKVIRIYSASSHAGYTKLCFEISDAELQYSNIEKNLFGVRHGPADKHNLISRLCDDSIERGYSQISSDALKANHGSSIKIVDSVTAVHCPYWPMEANEWIMRQRSNGFPSTSTVKQVVRYGCDFVQVSHKCSNDENEWRFSFSKPESIIIHSWTTSQRTVYRTLHMLCKIMSWSGSSALCTYYFKTLMLWATEQKVAEFWSDVLINSVCKLLFDLTNWLKIKLCPNYFIPSNNMLDHLTDADLSKDIDALCQLLQNTGLLIDVLYSSTDVEIENASKTYQIEAPMWLYTSLVIYDQILQCNDRDTKKFARSFSALLYKALNFELFNIYHGLMCYRKATNNLIYSIDKNYLLTSYIIKHFQSYKGPSSSWKQCVYLQHCSSTVVRSVLNWWFLDYEPNSHKTSAHHMMDTSLNTISVDDIETHNKFLLYSRILDELDMITSTDHFNENIGCKNEIRIALYETSTADNKTYASVKFYKEFPGLTPTVSISWFINKAFLANLYYTIQNDCSATEEICDNIINTYKLSYNNQIFADKVLPVILSTKWTSVYDKELQAILGLYSLCSVVFNKTDSSRSVCLGVCPVLFAWYLKCQCVADQMELERWKTCANDTVLHFRDCKCNRWVCNGMWALYSAFLVAEYSALLGLAVSE